VPRKGERVETPELSVTVEKVERTRVIEVVISLRRPQSTEAAA
jgi:CBS domain containing-hemolysin-like protein